MDEPWLLAVLAAAGIAAGIINTMAGGGSLLTLPALMLLGLPADVANGTNRLSVLTQSISGVYLFNREGKLERKAIAPVLAPTVLGSLLGALAASAAPAWILEPVMLGILMAVAVLIAVTPSRSVDQDASSNEPVDARERWLAWLGMFGAGLYGGFIQAGVGFVLLTVLVTVMKFDLIRANALKLVCTTVFGSVALVVFVAAGQVSWAPAAALAVATVIGSQIGVRVALEVNPKFIRWFIVICVCGSCVAIWLR